MERMGTLIYYCYLKMKTILIRCKVLIDHKSIWKVANILVETSRTGALNVTKVCKVN